MKAAQILPLFDDMAGFLESALQTHQEDQEKIAELQKKLDGTEKIILEKVAAAHPPLDPDKITKAFEKLANLGVLDNNVAEDIISAIKKDSNVVLPFVVKLAESLMNMPGEGKGVEAENRIDADPFGWEAMAAGKMPKLKP